MARGTATKRCPCKLAPGQHCKKPHGSWSFRIDVTSADGTRKQIRRSGFRSRDAAESELDSVRRRLEHGVWGDDAGITVAEWMTRWLEEREQSGHSPTTLVGYRSRWEKIWKPAIGKLRLRDLRRGHVEDVLRAEARKEITKRGTGTIRWEHNKRIAEGEKVKRSPHTISEYRRVLRNALADAVDAGLIITNPAAGKMRAIGDAGETKAAIWEPEQTAQYLDRALARDDWFSAAAELAAYGGLRRGEVAGLRWKDVLPDMILVRQTVVSVATKQLKQPQICKHCGRIHKSIFVKEPKTSRGTRWVPLVQPIKDALERQGHRQASPVPMFEDHGLVICDENGHPINPARITAEHRALCQSLGLPEIRFHDLRHGAASFLLAAGVPDTTVAMILGHDVQVLRRVYAHALRGETIKQVEKAADLVSRYRRAHSVPTSGDSDISG